jgi:hypothetical protein
VTLHFSSDLLTSLMQVYALAFWFGGELVAWNQANLGDVLKVPRLCSAFFSHISVAQLSCASAHEVGALLRSSSPSSSRPSVRPRMAA